MEERPIGKQYDGGAFPIRAAEYEAYAAATDDPNPAYRGSDSVAPPMFHVRPFIGLMLQLAGDPELEIDMLRLVHGEHGMVFHQLLRDGDSLALEGELTAVSEKSSGTVFAFALRGRVNGALAMEGHTSYFVRAKNPSSRPKGARPAPPELPEPTWTASQPVTADQADRYAVASGDNNPIHVSEAVAKKAGLPGVILHGLCSLAFAARDVVAHDCGGDPARLASLSVRFAAPVFPGETLEMSVWEEGTTRNFITRNATGKPVLSAGRAEVR